MRTQPLTKVATVVLDGTGAGTASLGPTQANETWTVSVVSVSASTNVKEAQCQVYSSAGAGTPVLIDTATWGSTGSSSNNFVAPLSFGDVIKANWTVGDAGAVATLVITGTRTVP